MPVAWHTAAAPGTIGGMLCVLRDGLNAKLTERQFTEPRFRREPDDPPVVVPEVKAGSGGGGEPSSESPQAVRRRLWAGSRYRPGEEPLLDTEGSVSGDD